MAGFKTRIKEAKVGYYIPHFTTPILCLYVIIALVIPDQARFLMSLLWLLTHATLVHYESHKRKQLQAVLGTILFIAQAAPLIPLLVLAMVNATYARNKDNHLRRLVEWMEGKIPDVDLNTGGHSSGIWEDVKIFLRDCPTNIFEPYINVHYAGPNEIDGMAQDQAHCIGEILEKPGKLGRHLIAAQEAMRKMFMLGTFLLCYVVYGASAILVVAALVMVMLLREDGETRMLIGGKTRKLVDGVYHLHYHFLGMYMGSSCIGVCHRGVLHAPFHGVGRTKLIIGDVAINPYFIDGDVITYGGLPKYSKITDGQEILANHENFGNSYSHGTVKVEYQLDDRTGEYIWKSASQPGQSGSGVWRKNEDGTLDLVGMVGNYGTSNGVRFEYFALPDCGVVSEDEFVKGDLIKITTYPGSGKTRTVIPKYVNAFLAHNRENNAICYVAGPTRVVAMEIYKALKPLYGGKLSLAIAHSGQLNRSNAPIQITTHATMMNIVMDGHRNVKMVIVDEAHVDNTATRMAVEFTEYISTQGGIGVLMSATLDGISNAESNFTIQDHTIQKKDLFTGIMAEVGQGRKCMVFTHSTKANFGCEGIAQKLKMEGARVVCLNRGTYQAVQEQIRNNDYDVIVATNIAECGFNADIDCVFDLGTEFDFFTNGEITRGQVVTIGEASRTQRRGRIGRRKEGHYYAVTGMNVQKPIGPKASEIDAEILLMGREWVPRVVKSHGYQLTDQQFAKAVDYPVTPSMTRILWDLNGKAVKGKEVRRRFEEEYFGGDLGPPCDECAQLCAAWQKYDDREHEIYHMIKKGVIRLAPYDPDPKPKRKKFHLFGGKDED